MGRAPFFLELPPEVPEGVEPVPVLVLVWDPEPEPEPVEPPGLLELVAAGGAAQKKREKIGYVTHQNEHCVNLLPAALTSKLGPVA